MATVLGMLSIKVLIVCVILYYASEKIIIKWLSKRDKFYDTIMAKAFDEYPWQVYAYALVKIATLIVGFFALLITIFNL